MNFPPPAIPEPDLRQSSGAALERVSKMVGGWAEQGPIFNYIDTTSTAAIPAQWSTPLLLNGLATGTGASQRVGRQILIHLIRMRFFGSSSQAVRFVLVYDRQSNGAAPSVTDIFESNTVASEINWSNRDRFDFVYDITLPICGDQHTEECIDGELSTNYNAGSTGTVADIASGALYLLMNDSGTTGTFAPIANIRLEYEE